MAAPVILPPGYNCNACPRPPQPPGVVCPAEYIPCPPHLVPVMDWAGYVLLGLLVALIAGLVFHARTQAVNRRQIARDQDRWLASRRDARVRYHPEDVR